MTWTTEKPTQPGWYWRRSRHHDGGVIQVECLYGCLSHRWGSEGDDVETVAEMGGEWAGPVPEPEEP